MDFNFAISGLLPQLSHFYLDEKSSSRAVCSRCSSLYIPGYNVTIEFVDQIPKGCDLVYKLNRNSLLKNVLKQKLESKNDSQETGLNLLDFLKTI